MTRETYLERKLAGACLYSTACGEPVDEDTPWCRVHRQRVGYLRRVRNMSQWRVTRARQSRRRWRKKRARQELCTRCQQPTARRKYLCRYHTELFDKYNSARKRAKEIAA